MQARYKLRFGGAWAFGELVSVGTEWSILHYRVIPVTIRAVHGYDHFRSNAHSRELMQMLPT